MRYFESSNWKGRRHLWFTAPNGRRILYAYIRKNGCSSVKTLLGGHSDSKVSEFEKYYHRGEPVDLAFFVYRDPIERVLSLYRDKVIDGRGAEDILANFHDVMPREDPSDFDAFAYFATKSNDPHCWKQVSHLRSIRYLALPLHQMSKLNTLIGPTDVFTRPSGASAKLRIDVPSHTRKLIGDFYVDDYAMIQKIERFDILDYIRNKFRSTP